jgi:hypothetical protein
MAPAIRISGPANLSALHPRTNRERVLQIGTQIPDRREAPARKHFLHTGLEFGVVWSAFAQPRVSKCTWLFQKPAVITLAVQVITRADIGIVISLLFPTATMVFPRIRIVASGREAAVGDGETVPPTRARS